MEFNEERVAGRAWDAFRRFSHCLEDLGRDHPKTKKAKFWDRAWEKAIEKHCPNHLLNLFPID